MSLRGYWIYLWCVGVFYALSLIVSSGILLHHIYGERILRGGLSFGSTASLVFFTLVLGMGLVGVLGLWALLVHLPRFWCAQGITVDRSGISVANEPMWWYRGHRAHIPWADVHHIAVSTRGISLRTRRPLIQVHLNRVDHGLHLPWRIALLQSGRTKWGVTASRPVLLVGIPERWSVKLVSLLRAARGDLFQDDGPGRWPSASRP